MFPNEGDCTNLKFSLHYIFFKPIIYNITNSNIINKIIIQIVILIKIYDDLEKSKIYVALPPPMNLHETQLPTDKN